ncbi:MAG: hypothetical protein ACP5O3_01645 [Candidatus Micrarchaeia archaeon]
MSSCPEIVKATVAALLFLMVFSSLASARTISVAGVETISVNGLTATVTPAVKDGTTTYQFSSPLLVKVKANFGGAKDYELSFYSSKLTIKKKVQDKLTPSNNSLKVGADTQFEVSDTTNTLVKSTQKGVYGAYIPLYEDACKQAKTSLEGVKLAIDFGDALVPVTLLNASYYDSKPIKTVFATKIVVSNVSTIDYPQSFENLKINFKEKNKAKYLCDWTDVSGELGETYSKYGGIKFKYDPKNLSKYPEIELSYATVSESNTKPTEIASIKSLYFDPPLKKEVIGDSFNANQDLVYELSSSPAADTRVAIKLEKNTLPSPKIFGFVRFLQSINALREGAPSYAQAVSQGYAGFSGKQVSDNVEKQVSDYYDELPSFVFHVLQQGSRLHEKGSDASHAFLTGFSVKLATSINGVYTVAARTESVDGETTNKFVPEDASKLSFAATNGKGVGQYVFQPNQKLKFKDTEFTFIASEKGVAYTTATETTVANPTPFSSEKEFHVKTTADGKYALVFSKDSAGQLVVTITDLSEKPSTPTPQKSAPQPSISCSVSNTAPAVDPKNPATYAANQIAFKVKFKSPPQGTIYATMAIKGSRVSPRTKQFELPEGVQADEEVEFSEFKGFAVQPSLSYQFGYSLSPHASPQMVQCRNEAGGGATYSSERARDNKEKTSKIKSLQPGECKAIYFACLDGSRSLSLRLTPPEGNYASYNAYFSTASAQQLNACLSNPACDVADFIQLFHPNLDAKLFANHFEWNNLNAFKGFNFDSYDSMVLGFTEENGEQTAVVCPIEKRFSSSVEVRGSVAFQGLLLSGDGFIGNAVVTAGATEVGEARITADGAYEFKSETLSKLIGSTTNFKVRARFKLPDGRIVGGEKTIYGYQVSDAIKTEGLNLRPVMFSDQDVVGAQAKPVTITLKGRVYNGFVAAENAVQGSIAVQGESKNAVALKDGFFTGLRHEIQPEELDTKQTLSFCIGGTTAAGEKVSGCTYAELTLSQEADAGTIIINTVEKPAPQKDALASEYFKTTFFGEAYYDNPAQKIESGSFKVIADNAEVCSGQLSAGRFQCVAWAFKNEERIQAKHFALEVSGWLADEQTLVQGTTSLGFRTPAEAMDFGALEFNEGNAHATKQQRKADYVGVEFSGTAYVFEATPENAFSSGQIWIEGDEDHKAFIGENGGFTIQTYVAREDYKKSFKLTLYVDGRKGAYAVKGKVTLSERAILAFNDLKAVVFKPKARQEGAAAQPSPAQVFVTGSPAVDGKEILTGDIAFFDENGARLGEGRVDNNFFSFKLYASKEDLGKQKCLTARVRGALKDGSFFDGSTKSCVELGEFGVNFETLEFKSSEGTMYSSQAKAPKKEPVKQSKKEDTLSFTLKGRASWLNTETPLPGATVLLAADPTASAFAGANAEFSVPVSLEKELAGSLVEFALKARFKDASGKQREASALASALLPKQGGEVDLGEVVFDPQPDLLPLVPSTPAPANKVIYVVFVPFNKNFEVENKYYKGLSEVSLNDLTEQCDIEPREHPRCVAKFVVPYNLALAKLTIKVAGEILSSTQIKTGYYDAGVIDLTKAGDGDTIDLGQVSVVSLEVEQQPASTAEQQAPQQTKQQASQATKKITLLFRPLLAASAKLAFPASFYAGVASVEAGEACDENGCARAEIASDETSIPSSGAPLAVTLSVPANALALSKITFKATGWASEKSFQAGEKPVDAVLYYSERVALNKNNKIDFGTIVLTEVKR